MVILHLSMDFSILIMQVLKMPTEMVYQMIYPRCQ